MHRCSSYLLQNNIPHDTATDARAHATLVVARIPTILVLIVSVVAAVLLIVLTVVAIAVSSVTSSRRYKITNLI